MPSRHRAQPVMQAHIRTVMNDQLITVGPDEPLVNVAREIAAHGIGCVPVIDERHQLLGIVSTTDLVNLLHDGGRLDDKLARDVMTRKPVAIDEFATADEAIGVIRNAAVRHLPVTREGRLVGIVAAADLIRHLLKDHLPPEIA
jgi:CBS domain-containing protein